MAASQHPLDDRQHSHAIRRRQGGRTSMYHDVVYPAAIPWWMFMDPSLTQGVSDGADDASPPPVGSDYSTGAY